MIIIVGALALMVGVIASLTLESWWILVAVMAVHGLLSAIVVGFTMRQVDKQGGKPDPVTEARLEAGASEAEREQVQREELQREERQREAAG